MGGTLGRARNGAVEIAHESYQGDAGEPLLLIMGFTADRHFWPDGLCDELIGHGFAVVRFDNRDSGESTHLDHLRAPSWPAIMMMPQRVASYRLEEMADDAVAVMDDRGWQQAHVMGVSMGGMIAQTLAIRHPNRVRSLTSISSTPSPMIGRPTLSAQRILTMRAGKTADEAADRLIRQSRIIGSPQYPVDEPWLRAYARRAFERGSDPAAGRRQLAAVMASGSRLHMLHRVSAPTLVVHGSCDPLIRAVGGRATAQAVPGARLVLHRGMAHDLPAGLWGKIAADVAGIAAVAA
jgi:pimeloyl-ACP methyl ester carboxylesterase